jgi:hypothetical protein
MFRCQKTGKLSKPGEKPVRVVIETREKTYTIPARDPRKDPKVTHGWEIVRELLVLPEVAAQLQAKN